MNLRKIFNFISETGERVVMYDEKTDKLFSIHEALCPDDDIEDEEFEERWQEDMEPEMLAQINHDLEIARQADEGKEKDVNLEKKQAQDDDQYYVEPVIS